ncbi:hypothetical protein ACIPPM_21550 [Streptomyces sp. NPDC090119]|uniref:hypothetical protein n=1 Tax=Streptomyces sp. NPDC090119 TaxID=3365951 RepID=UPI003808931B
MHRLPDILRVLPQGVRKIGLAENSSLRDLRPLASLHSLDRVGFRQCPQVDDLSPLMDLSLTKLYVHVVGAASGLERLTTLRELTVRTVLPAGLRNLPHNASLRTLRVDGLRGLSDWPMLEQLDPFGNDELLHRLCPNLRTAHLGTSHYGMVLDVSTYAEDFPGVEVKAPRTRPYAL